MKLRNLQTFDTFVLEDTSYEVKYVSPSGRIAVCYVLTQNGDYIPSDSIYDAPGAYKSATITDVRYDAVYATDEEKDLDSIL